ncbi:MAG: hypothetical protein KUG64_10260, partial [Cycloclasticus sp.]|nr:hypothetical protein [Cycloclasticus sp.]
QEDLDRQKAQELLNAETTGADKALIEAKFAKFNKKLDQEQRKGQVDEALGAFNAIQGLAAGNAEAAKALAISQAIINGFQGVTAVLAATSVIPEPFGSVVKGVSAAAIGATALINVNKIRSTPVPTQKKAARGAGFFGGEPHSRGGTKGVFSDGTNIEVEKDEAFFVVNKRSSSFIDRINGLNQMNGYGDDFFGRGGKKTFLQDGGIGLDAVSSSIQEEQSSVSAAVEAVSALPAPIVVIQDINQAQGDEIEVVSRAEA